MKWRKSHWLFCLGSWYCLLPILGWGQVKMTTTFQSQLEEAKLDFVYPLEGKYKSATPIKNAYLNYPFAIRSKREKIEIRYFIAPSITNELVSVAPHAASMQMVLHLATNDETAMISNLPISPNRLKEDFNADWGKVAIFKPKLSFSSRTYCKMLAIYKEGIGMAYAFFLFDKNSLELDNRFLALRFQGEPME